jgi:hypothetical protein
MESPERSLIIDVIMNSNTPKLYPQLSEVQKDRIFADLLQEYRLRHCQLVGGQHEHLARGPISPSLETFTRRRGGW